MRVMLDGDGATVTEQDDLAAVGGLERGAVQHPAGGPKATWPPFRHSTRSNSRALSTSWLETSRV